MLLVHGVHKITYEKRTLMICFCCCCCFMTTAAADILSKPLTPSISRELLMFSVEGKPHLCCEVSFCFLPFVVSHATE